MVLLIQISTNERGRFEQIGRLLGALRPLYTRAGTFHHFSLFPRPRFAQTLLGAPQLTEPQVNTAPPVVSPPLLTEQGLNPRRNHNNPNRRLVPRTKWAPSRVLSLKIRPVCGFQREEGVSKLLSRAGRGVKALSTHCNALCFRRRWRKWRKRIEKPCYDLDALHLN